MTVLLLKPDGTARLRTIPDGAQVRHKGAKPAQIEKLAYTIHYDRAASAAGEAFNAIANSLTAEQLYGTVLLSSRGDFKAECEYLRVKCNVEVKYESD